MNEPQYESFFRYQSVNKMQNESDELEKNGVPSYEKECEHDSESNRNDLRGENSGRRSASYGNWTGRSSRTTVPESERVLLKAVNDVLNRRFPQKTLFCGYEFDVFRDCVTEAIPEMAADPFSYLLSIHAVESPANHEAADRTVDREAADRAVDEVLRDWFFYAGGTLVGELADRNTRIHEQKKYFQSHAKAFRRRLDRRPKSIDDSALEELNAFLEKSSGSDNQQEDYPRRLSMTEDREERISFSDRNDLERNVDVSFSDKKPNAQGEESLGQRPWNSSYLKVARLVRRYFYGEALDAESYSVFRRLFFLNSEKSKEATISDFGSSDSLDSLVEVIAEAVNETYPYPTLSLFEVESLGDFFEKLNGKTLLEKISSGEMDKVAQIALYFIGLKINPGDREELTDASDFDNEYELIAKFVLHDRFRNRRFNRDFSDFEDYYNEYRSEFGAHMAPPESKVRELFKKVGGSFSEPVVRSEEVEVPTMTRGEMLKKALAEHFSLGLELFEPADLARFRDICEGYGGKDAVDVSDDKLRAMICRCAITCDDRAYSITEKNKKILKQAFESLSRVGVSVVYYEAWFKKNEKWLTSVNVPNWYVLRALLASCFPRYTFYDYYLETNRKLKLEFLKVLDEIKRLWGNVEVRTPMELAERIYVPLKQIKLVLSIDTNDFVRVEGGYSYTTSETAPAVLLGDRMLDEKFCKEFDYHYPTDGVSGKEFQMILSDEIKNHKGNPAREEDRFERNTESAEIDVRKRFLQEENAQDESVEPSSALKVSNKESISNTAILKTANATNLGGGVDGVNWRKHANMIAKILSSNFKDGLSTTSPKALKLFRDIAEGKGLKLSESVDELLAQLLRVGFLCDDRIFVVSQKTKAFVIDYVDSWFELGGSVIYYDAFFDRYADVLSKGGVPNVGVLENRLRKYYPDYAFSTEGYFEVKEDMTRTLDEKIRDDIFVVWDGSSSKRLNDLAEAIYVPREKIEEVMKSDGVNFDVRSNGYWTRDGRATDGAGKKRVVSKRKSSRRKSSSDSLNDD